MLTLFGQLSFESLTLRLLALIQGFPLTDLVVQLIYSGMQIVVFGLKLTVFL